MRNIYHLLFLLALLLGTAAAQAQVGIGTTTPNSKAALDVQTATNDKGMLIPRLNSTERRAILNPPQGLMVFQTGTATVAADSVGFWYASGTVNGSGVGRWLYLPDRATAGDNLGNHTATQALNLGANQLVGNGGSSGIYIDNAGQVGVGTTSPSQKLQVAGSAIVNTSLSIGTASTAYPLSVVAGSSSLTLASLQSSNTTGSRLLMNNVSTGGALWTIGSTGSASADGVGKFTIADASATRLTLNGSGQLGLGTSSPAARLDLVGGNNATGNLSGATDAVAFQYNTGGYRHFLRSRHNSAVTGALGFGNSLDFYLNNSSSSAGSTAPGTGNIIGMTIENNQGSPRVGIGTTSPSATLHVSGATSTVKFDGLAGTGTRLVTADLNGNLSTTAAVTGESTTATNGLTLTGTAVKLGGTLTGATTIAQAGNAFSLTGGNVGIGTTSPAGQLHSVSTPGSDATNDYIFEDFRNGTGTTQYMVQRAADGTAAAPAALGDGSTTGINLGGYLFSPRLSTGYPGNGFTGTGMAGFYRGDGTNNLTELRFTTSGSTRMTLDGTGNVGIGTTSPAAKLDVSGAIGISSGDGDKIYLTNANANGSKLSQTAGWSMDYNAGPGTSGTSNTGQHRFFTTISGAYQERMRISTAGNVGIGTTSPSKTLDVNGDIRASGTTTSTTYTFGALSDDVSPVITARTVPSDQQTTVNPLQSELILFHSNDSGTGAGPDQITLRAPQLNFQTYTNSTVDDVDDVNGYNERMVISPTGTVKVSNLAGTGTRVVTADASGTLSTTTTASLADNLGNHTATQNIQLGTNQLVGNGGNMGIYVSSAGNVGIATTTTNGYRLNVNGTTNVASTLNVTGESTLAGIRLPGGFAADATYVGLTGNSISFAHSGISEDFIGYKSNTFYLKDSPGGSDNVDPNLVVGGNVGIGTNSPSQKLDVNGNVNVTGNTVASGSSTAASFTFPVSNASDDAAPLITSRIIPLTQGNTQAAPSDQGRPTEMILFHSNDGNTNNGGSDQITLRAPQLNFQTYNNTTVNSINDDNGYNQRMKIDPDGVVTVNTLAGTGTRVVTADATGNLSATSALPTGESTTASNGLTLTGSTVQLGGTLGAATTVAQAGNNFAFTGSGNVGVGTASPTAKLEVVGSETTTHGTGAAIQLQNSAATIANRWYLRAGGPGTSTNDGGLSFGDNANYLMQLTQNGRVGIMTTAPTAVLDVNGSTRLRGLTTAGVVTTDASGNLSSVASSTLGDNFGNHTATQGLFLNSTNDVYLRGSTASPDTDHGLGWYGSGKPWGTYTPDGPVLYGHGGGIMGNSVFGVRTAVLVWNPTGQVAIGASPSGAGTFQVSGTTQLSGNLGLTTISDLLLKGLGDANHGLGWYGSGRDWNGTTPDGPVLYGFNGGILGLNVAGVKSAALAWDGSGRVGIGTTSPAATLHVAGSTSTVRLEALAGTGTRMVTADASGNLATAAVPVDTDAQTLSISGGAITISGSGSSVTVPDISSTNELQTISKTGSNVTLSNGGGSFTDTDTDAQTLSVTGSNLAISNGNSVTLPTGESTTASNGLTLVGSDVKLGGTLSAATTIAQGSNDLTFTGTGNVGIGTTSVTSGYKLDVSGAANVSGLANVGGVVKSPGLVSNSIGSLSAFNAADAGMYFKSGGVLQFVSAGADRMQIDASGNVGVGNTLPSAKLHVSGTVKVDAANTIELGAGVSGKESNAGKIGYQTFTTGTLDIVGAGTLATNRKIKLWSEGGLDVSGAMTTAGAITAGGNVQLGTNKLVGTGGSTGLAIGNTGIVTTDAQLNAGGNVNLGTNKLVGNGGTAGISVSSTGQVGVGVTAPSGQFGNTTVNTIGADGHGGNISSGIGTLNWTMNTDGFAASIYNGSGVAGADGLAVKVLGTDATSNVLDVSKGAQGTTGTPLLVVKASGNVGVGNSSPGSTLTVSGTTAFTPALTITGGPLGTPKALSLSSATYLGLSPADATNSYYQLPDPATSAGRMYVIRNNSSSVTANLSTAAGALFNGSGNGSFSSYGLGPNTAGKTVIVFSDGANWTIGQLN